MSIGRAAFALALIMAVTGTLAADTPRAPAPTGTLVRNEAMRREPFTDARTLTTLRTRARVTILERRGSWYRVSSGSRSGWIRLLAVRTTPATPVRRVASPETGRAGTGGLVSTTGIRALDAGALRTAVFSETETARLESLAVTPDAARHFAEQRPLRTRALPYLPAPRAANPAPARTTRR